MRRARPPSSPCCACLPSADDPQLSVGRCLQEMHRLGIAGEGGAAASRQLPTLQALFATPVEPLEDIDYLPEK